LQLAGGPPTQFPPLQVSLVVQLSPSLHAAVLFVYTHPVPGSQLSSVQTLPSLQFGAGPPTHVPPVQVSAVVQALLSSHGALLLACVQPLAGLQLSSVQTLLSSQSSAGPLPQAPPLQVSVVVQASPSLHGAVLLACTHPVMVLQLSSVQTFPSSQLGGGPPTQAPLLQASFVVQASPSLQGLLLLVCTHPVMASQLSSVQTLPSLQFGGGPPAQLPPLQVSLVVQASPSSHGAVLLALTHPVAGLQLSSVHTLLSLQSGGGPPTQVPPVQASLVVHKLPSLHGALLLAWTHPIEGLQLSSVQTLPSSQFTGSLTQR
jgi:hypothetical protein